MITEISLEEDFQKIKQEVLDLLIYHKNPYQLCLQGTEPNFQDWGAGTGSIKELDSIYCHIHSSLENSEIARVIKRHNAVRTRIMRMNPKYCYSVHHDRSKRIHIPIVTDNQAWMVWPYNNFCTQLEEGKMYLTDTTKPHSFFNGSTEERIHLVMCV